MKCEECGEETNSIVCRECGLVIDDRPIARDLIPIVYHDKEVGDRKEIDHDTREHPLIPNIRRESRAFQVRYQDDDFGHVYIRAYGTINKLCGQLRLPKNVRFEALNLFKGIRKLDGNFFRVHKLAPTYLACIKISCKLNDFPIMNHDLANVIDYKIMDSKNLSYMEKKFNRAYRGILKLYKLRIKQPVHPRFIDFACTRLGLPCDFVKKIHLKYTKLRKYFEPHFRIEGYILALIYIYGNRQYGFYLKTLETLFHTSTKTIVNRKNEILKYEKKGYK